MFRLSRALIALSVLLLFTGSTASDENSLFKDGFEEPPFRLIHRWTFSETGGSGTSLIDDIGGANGTIIEVGNWNAWAAFGRLIIYGSQKGGSQATSDYATLPAGLLSGLEDATIEIWATHDSVSSWGRIFDVGDSTANSLLMTWDFAGDASSDRMQWRGPDDEVIDGAMAPYVIGTEYQIVMTIEQPEDGGDASLVRLYRDGVLQGEQFVDNALADVADGDFLLARSRYPDESTASCTYNEIRIYKGAMTGEDVALRFSKGPVEDKAINNIDMVESIQAHIGNRISIDYTVISTAGSIDQGVSWLSTNPTVATVDRDGLLTAKVPGTTLITATSWADPALSANALVTVHPTTTKHLWTFSETGDSGTVLMDTVGLREGQLVGVGSNDASVGNGRVTLSGGARDAADYINLGDNLTHGLTDFMIELWASTNGAKAWSRIFDLGPDISNNLMMSWTQFANPATDRIEMRRNGVTAFTANDTMAPYATGVDHHIVLKVNENANQQGQTILQWFLNGEFKGGMAVDQTWSDLQDTNNWLGRSKYPDETAYATYNEFRIYNGLLTYPEIQANYASGPVGGGAVYGVQIAGPKQVQSGQTIQLTASVTSSAGAISQDVTWTSDNEDIAVVYSNGVVTGAEAGVTSIRATSTAVPGASRIHSVSVTPKPPVATNAFLYHPEEDHFMWFKDSEYTIQVWGQPFPESTGYTQADWTAAWGSDSIDAAYFDRGNDKVYMFQSVWYARFSSNGVVDAGFPKRISEEWSEWPSTWGSGDVDAVVYSPNNDKIYFFKGSEYSRATRGGGVDPGYPKPIKDNWDGWPASWGEGDVDAVTYYPGIDKFYLFKGLEYVRHSLGGSIDSGYPKPFSEWRNDAPQAAVDLVGDFARLKTSWTTRQWDGIGFPDGWEDSRGLSAHIQGVTRVSADRWVLSHNREDDPGFLIHGTNNDFTFDTWSAWGPHPGSIQAAGNVVAVPIEEPQEVRFVHFGTHGPVELTHLRTVDVDTGLPNSAGLAYYPPHNAYYLIIGITTNRTEVKDYPLYKSHAGKSLLDPTNRFERMGPRWKEGSAAPQGSGTVNVEGSETGMQLMYDEKTGTMHLLTLYRGDGDGLLVPNYHRAVLSRLDFPATVQDEGPYPSYFFTGAKLSAREDFDVSGGIFTDPSFRFGAGAILDESGRLNLIATERCIPPLYFWMQSCQGDGDGLDHFILKP